MESVGLPEGVEKVVVKKRGKTYSYFYWNPHRGTGREGDRIKLPNAKTHPADFWREVDRYVQGRASTFPKFSVGALVDEFTADDNAEWKRLSESTRAGYMVHARRFKIVWGPMAARGIRPAAALALRDAVAETPTTANHMLAFGRTLWNWGIPRDYSENNPFGHIKDIETPDRGHVPWPPFIVDYVRRHGTEDLRRMVLLGTATCQRESDLIRMGPGQRERAGIWCRPKKTRRKKKAFLIPLAITDVIEIDRWAETPMVFTNSRWKAPRPQHNKELYLYGPRGRAYTEDSLRSRYNRWLETDEGKELCRLWQAWLKEQVSKYEWDISPDEMQNPTIHGLRGTGILVRFAEGNAVEQIANDIGMSRPMVDRYMRFKDQVEIAAAGPARLRLVEN
jgi:integrase